MRAFDPLSVPLEGLQLLEASAGTGKTHALADLHLRLLIERRLGIEHVLVLTFTNAAAAELRDRLRRRLTDALASVREGTAECDVVLDAAFRAGRLAPTDAVLLLRTALADYDRAPIGTLHSFCRRVLDEHAVECGVGGRWPIEPPNAELDDEIARALLRRQIAATAGDPPARLALGWTLQAIDARHLPALARRTADGGRWRIEPDPDSPPPYANLAAQFLDARDRLLDAWATAAGSTIDALAAAGLNRASYSRQRLERLFAGTAIWLKYPTLPAKDLPLAKLSTSALNARLNKGGRLPDLPLLSAIDKTVAAATALAAAAEQAAAALLARLVRDSLDERRRQLERLEVLHYDDLIRLVREAMTPPAPPRLAARLAAVYPAALVDEFQDTDPAQYEILNALRRQGAALFLVGDPKQSIYSFRGADIFAYGTAAREAHRHTLHQNWRSAPGLVRAVQAVFRRSDPFALDFIGMPPVKPAPRPDPPRRLLNGDEPPPFTLWLFSPDGANDLMGRVEARARIAQGVAAAIIELLRPGSPARLAGRRGAEQAVEPGDIAVLVATHREGRLVQEVLRTHGIPTVSSGQISVFATDDARHLRLALRALLQPRREDLLRGAALTPLLGWTPAELAAPESTAWSAMAARWVGYHRAWTERGFRVTFERWLAGEGVIERLLGRPDGERRATNLRHLADLLSEAEADRRLGPAALLGWLDAQLRGSDEATEETELRLDSDARRVRVTTIHQSKGLQYPIVFCPFLWALPRRDTPHRPAVFHDPDAGGQRAMDFGGPDLERHLRQEALERFQESLRLIYVALTRAQAACYVAWGPIRRADTSALAWLLHGAADLPPGSAVDAVTHWDEARIQADLDALTTAADGGVSVAPLPDAPAAILPATAMGTRLGEARTFAGCLDDGWRITSFSVLRSPARAGTPEEEPDHDEAAAPLPGAVEPSDDDKARFPVGADAGQVLHEILEAAVPDLRGEPLLAEIEQRLRLHGFDAATWAPAALRIVQETLATPLNVDGLRLCDLDPARCARELPFLMRMGPVDAPALNARLGRAAASDGRGPSPLEFPPMRGFIKGFIDLVFEADGRWYVVDYKSNWLGPTRDDYRPERLAAEMAAADYELQAWLYCVALRRLMIARGETSDGFDRRFGGAFYLFLRGMAPSNGPTRGVYFFRPDPAQLAELSDTLDGRGGTAP